MSIVNGLFTVWVFLLVLTHILGSYYETPSDEFPTECKLTTNCVRLAYNNSINAEGKAIATFPLFQTFLFWIPLHFKFLKTIRIYYLCAGLKIPMYATNVQTIAGEIDSFFVRSSLSTLIASSKDQKFIRWRTLTKM